jgi:hypothetical protein
MSLVISSRRGAFDERANIAAIGNPIGAPSNVTPTRTDASPRIDARPETVEYCRFTPRDGQIAKFL